MAEGDPFRPLITESGFHGSWYVRERRGIGQGGVSQRPATAVASGKVGECIWHLTLLQKPLDQRSSRRSASWFETREA